MRGVSKDARRSARGPSFETRAQEGTLLRMRAVVQLDFVPPSVTSTISGGTPRRNGMMLQPRPPETMTSQFMRMWP